MGFLENATVNTLYFVLVGLGLTYALVLLFFGQFHADADFDVDLDMDADLDVGGGDVHGISPISPLTIAVFVTGFGTIGIVSTNLFGVSDRGSVIWAILGGVVFSTIAYLGITYLLIKPQGSSEVRISDLAGTIGEVITPIPADGMGEIAFVAQGGRIAYSARSTTNSDIKRGAVVRIVRIVGGVAYVAPHQDEEISS